MLINRQKVGMHLGLDFDSPGSTDGAFLGDCDVGAQKLCELLGWDIGSGMPSCGGSGGGDGGGGGGGDGSRSDDTVGYASGSQMGRIDGRSWSGMPGGWS